MLSLIRSLALLGLVGCAIAQNTGSPVHFDIDASQGNKTEFVIASFIETNVNRADDGGLYAELIQNRAFQEASSYLTIPGWAKYGDVALYQDPDTPLAALPRSLEIYVFGNSSDSAQRAGVNNTGWWGIPIKPQPYKASFWVKRGLGSAPIQGTIQVALASLTDGRTYATASFPGSSVAEDWKQLSATLHPTAAAPDTNNVFSLTLFVASHDQAVWINLVSLFPPTFKNRPNGLRIDLSEALQDLKPKFIRIPGGCNLQGSDIAKRFNWTNSIGDLVDRPGRPGYWIGYDTDGMGLYELLTMVEDLGATPILGVFDGYAANDESIANTSQLDKYITDAVNELHFVLGDAKTNKWAKKRADLGHPEPFELHYVEVGNEDFTSITYSYRWQRFYNALRAAYPNVNYIASATIAGVKLPVVDLHDFSGPDFFYSQFDRYDNWPRNGTKIWELENGVINTNSADPFGQAATRFLYPTIQGSVAEAVFALGMQRNGDLLLGTSYAPYLSNINASQWTPNLITFNSSAISLSTSYYVHQMISNADADTTHPVTTAANFGPLYWFASSVNASTYFLQIANIDANPVSVTGSIHNITRPVHSTGSVNATATILAAKPGQPYNASNTLPDPNAVVPSVLPLTATLNGSSIGFNAQVPGWSFQVYRFAL